MRKQAERYQLALIILGLLVSLFFAVFFYRELFPQYRVFQDTYVELENIRSRLTNEPAPPFKRGVKQILLEGDNGGPAIVDRCISCHVALQFENFSPTRIEKDVNGNIVRDEKGDPVQEENPNYIWGLLDEQITKFEETDPSKAEDLKSLKTATLDGHVYDMTKALSMHPLMGRETRPFEYHPIDDYGCVSCHSGNGRALTISKAHGPVYDGQYEERDEGPEPVFLESDPDKDPAFARVFNGAPSHELLFQTTPILVGPLMQAKCIQCHQLSEDAITSSVEQANTTLERAKKQIEVKKQAYEEEKRAFIALFQIRKTVNKEGYEATKELLEKRKNDLLLSASERSKAAAQLRFIQNPGAIEDKIKEMVGSLEVAESLNLAFTGREQDAENVLSQLPSGTLVLKHKALQRVKDNNYHIDELKPPPVNVATEIDALLQNYKRGKFLFFNQACYACHRITGLSRGGVGPELTEAGGMFPWDLKSDISWPQGDLKTSTMPNFRLDHEELQDLVTYLLSQTGQNQSVSDTDHVISTAKWEAGQKLPWEEPINPAKLKDLNYAMTVFATEGCASCHRLKGYSSNIGFKKELTHSDFETIYKEREWFRKLFPEETLGSSIVQAINENSKEIDERIVHDVREKSILDELEEDHPDLLESFYQNFKFASRDKSDDIWKERVNRVLMMYIQEYGLGRLIGPRPNWSGIYRSDEWLIEHFRKPTRHVARSLMPVMPFDDTKFYALTFMLNTLAKQNRDEVREIWENRGFQPELAFELFCAQCHGSHLYGNGPVAQWIYPIPKNLRNTYFLRNFTKENMKHSLIHGVKGTPMPPWGEIGDDKRDIKTPVMTESEINKLTDWIYSSQLKGTRLQEEVPKWQYSPEDILEELKREGSTLDPGELPEFFELRESKATFLPEIEPKQNKVMDPEEVFDIEKNPLEGPDPFVYHIKKKYYTEENLLKGQRFFEVNCSVCHGIEADGQGYRAGSMYDAKPRMLTNLHWVDQRDDLRLLRSIKYGVLGTSMTPWGDQTSSLQRLQLVMYIRALSEEQKQRDKLLNSLYRTYDRADQTITEARAIEYKSTDEIENELDFVTKERSSLFSEVETGEVASNIAIQSYQKEIELSRSLSLHKKADHLLQELRDEVQKERTIYRTIGVDLIRRTILTDLFEKYISMIELNPFEYALQDEKLILNTYAEKEKESVALQKELIETISTEIVQRENNKKIVEGRLPSLEKSNQLEMLNNEISAFLKLKRDMVSGFEEIGRLRDRQHRIYNEYQEQLKDLR